MYTTPATTVGLASRAGAGLPLITGGCQCHTWCAEAAFDGVNAVALLTELCCGPCSYCGQSRFGARACLAAAALAGAPAATAAGTSIRPAAVNAAISVARRRVMVALDIAGSFPRRSPPPARVAEADGNRTRRRRSAPSTGFEDRGGHQAPGRLRRRHYIGPHDRHRGRPAYPVRAGRRLRVQDPARRAGGDDQQARARWP